MVINFHRLCSVRKIDYICCVPAQISYLGKFLFLRYGPNSTQPVRLQDFLISHITRNNLWNSLLFCMLIQIHKSWSKKNLLAMVKNGCGQSGLWALNWLYLKSELIELTNLWHVGTDSPKLKCDWKFWGWAWSEMGVTNLIMGHKNWLYLKNEQLE